MLSIAWQPALGLWGGHVGWGELPLAGTFEQVAEVAGLQRGLFC